MSKRLMLDPSCHRAEPSVQCWLKARCKDKPHTCLAPPPPLAAQPLVGDFNSRPVGFVAFELIKACGAWYLISQGFVILIDTKHAE